MEKETINLKESKEAIWESSEGRKEWEKCYIITKN